MGWLSLISLLIQLGLKLLDLFGNKESKKPYEKAIDLRKKRRGEAEKALDNLQRRKLEDVRQYLNDSVDAIRAMRELRRKKANRPKK